MTSSVVSQLARSLSRQPLSRRALSRWLGGGLTAVTAALAMPTWDRRHGSSRIARAQAVPARPFPQHLSYGAIRPRGSQEDLDTDVRSFYAYWKTNYLVQVGADQWRVAFAKPDTPGHNNTVSEGQGYGMIIVAIMAGHDPAAQTIFDGLWRFVLTLPSENDERLMDWNYQLDEGNASAFDGDADIAYGLLLADAQWGSAGAIDYRGAFDRVLAGIKASTIGPRSRLPMLGDWVIPGGNKYNQYTPRSSDFMPGHFRAFARATGDPVWHQVAGACSQVVNYIQRKHSRQTGLLPDFIQPDSIRKKHWKPARPNFIEKETDGAYNYNAGRVPWRLGTDALLNKNRASAKQARKISSWARKETSGRPARLRSGYRLNGKPLPNSNYFSTFFAAPIGVAAMTSRTQQAWLNAIYAAVRNRREDYYEDSVNLICLLVMTGNFWQP